MKSKMPIRTTIVAAAAALSVTVMPCRVRAADSQMEWHLTHPVADFSPGLGDSRSSGAQDYFFLGAGAASPCSRT
jgi:hypothetical protein